MQQFKIDDNNGIPVWIQVRRRLIYLIISGVYQSGEQLPTVRELAVQLDINYNTVNKVYQDLERDGFIETKRGKGTFVAQQDAMALLDLDNKIELLADDFVREAFDFGMDDDDIIKTVEERIRQYHGGTGKKSSAPAEQRSRNIKTA